jgi:hypothetical protein
MTLIAPLKDDFKKVIKNLNKWGFIYENTRPNYYLKNNRSILSTIKWCYRLCI